MGDEVNIGRDSENTWAAVRCPFYKGSGYRDKTLPDNKNWSRSNSFGPSPTPFSSGYPESVTPIMRAFPFIKVASSISLGYSTSMSLGVHDVVDPHLPGEESTHHFLLCAGESQANLFSFLPYRLDEFVYNGYGGLGPDPTSGIVGYDINSTRATMYGAVIVVKFYPIPGMDETTVNVTLDDEKILKLFPDNVNGPQFYDAEAGINIGDYIWSADKDPADLPHPFWKIESVTLA